MVTTSNVKPDLTAIKAKQQAAWADGDYARIGRTLTIMAEQLCETANVQAGSDVLDVAAGPGTVAFAAARRGANVIAIDYVPSLLELGRRESAANGLNVDFRDGDAEALAFPDASFDTVLSNVGVMFTPDQDRAAQELLRVTRPGGRIGLANWTPEGFVGQMFKIIGSYVTPPAGVPSPLAWGKEERVRELLGADVSAYTVTRRTFNFRYRSAEDWLTTFRTYYGPMARAFGALDAERQAQFARDLTALATRLNTSDTALQVPGEYLEIVAVRR